MRNLLIALYLLPTVALAQQLHTFKNGEVADAEKINETHQYILNNASGGCSVEQVDNTAEITCADGSTAVIAGAGTVVVYPEGAVGEVDPNSIDTGDIVVIDAMDVVLGKVRQTRDDSVGTIEMPRSLMKIIRSYTYRTLTPDNQCLSANGPIILIVCISVRKIVRGK